MPLIPAVPLPPRVAPPGYEPILAPTPPDRPPMRQIGAHCVLVSLDWRGVDARGALLEVARCSWLEHLGGPPAQAYLSETLPDVVKGWHCHKRQFDRFVPIRGRVVVALFDLTSPDPTERVVEVVLDARTPALLMIPPHVAHGWIALTDATILNLPTEEYDGSDEFRRPAHDGPAEGVPYDWRRNRDG